MGDSILLKTPSVDKCKQCEENRQLDMIGKLDTVRRGLWDDHMREVKASFHKVRSVYGNEFLKISSDLEDAFHLPDLVTNLQYIGQRPAVSNQTVTVTENKIPSDPLDEYNQFSSGQTRTRPEEEHYCMIYAFRSRDAMTNSFADICALEKIMEKELKSQSPRKHVLQTKDNCKGNGKAVNNVKQLLGWINSSRNKLFESITFYYLVEGHTERFCKNFIKIAKNDLKRPFLTLK